MKESPVRMSAGHIIQHAFRKMSQRPVSGIIETAGVIDEARGNIEIG